MSKLVVVGTIAYDAIETPFGKTDKILGGAATFIGLAASHFNVDTALVSVVGGDFEKNYLELLQSRNLNLDGVEVIEDGKTFFWSGKYHTDLNSRDTLVTELNTLENFNPVVPEDYRDAKVVMLGNLHPAVQLGVLSQMTQAELVILDTMNFWMDTSMELLKEVISKVHVITINDSEARQLSGEYSLRKAARIIQSMGPNHVVIKKGEHGALLFHEDGSIFNAAALPLEEVYDPTGAGDTFAGGFAGYLAAEEKYDFESMKQAIIYGSALASFCVEKFGTERLVEIGKADLLSRLKEFKSLTHFDLK